MSDETDTAVVKNPHPPSGADFFVWELEQVRDDVRLYRTSNGKQGTDPLDAKRHQEYWKTEAETAGVDIEEEMRGRQDPLRRLLADPDLCHHNEQQLGQLRESMSAAEAIGAEELTVKKKWLALIDETLALQRKARSNLVYHAIYVLRCQETGDILTMAPIHIKIFKGWLDLVYPNSLTAAPPSVGKTTLLYAIDTWGIKEDTRIRLLKVCYDMQTAGKRLEVLRVYVKSARYRALYPHVRLDPIKPDNARQFTVIRANDTSQDPTVEAAGWSTAIQGSGFDEIDCDDLCDVKVRHEPTTREKQWQSFHGVIMRRRRNFQTARVRYIYTPWHIDDVAGRIKAHIRQGKFRRWLVNKCPVLESPDKTPIPPLDRPGFVKELEDIRASDPVTYACCYKLDPRDSSLRMLKRVIYYDVSGGTDPRCPADAKERYANLLREIRSGERWYVLDPAAGGADDTGAVTFSLSAGGRAAVTAARFFRGKSTEAIAPICDHVEQQAVDRVLIEGQGQGKAQADMWAAFLVAKFGTDFQGRVFVTGTRFGTRGAGRPGQNRSKTARFHNILPYLEEGVILFPGEWTRGSKPYLTCTSDVALTQLHGQLFDYPNGQRDDGLDCVSLFANHHVSRLVRQVTPMTVDKPVVTQKPTTNVLTIARRELDKRKAAQAEDARNLNQEWNFFAEAV